MNPKYQGALLGINMIFSAFLIVADQAVLWKDELFFPIGITGLVLNTLYLVDLILSIVVLRITNLRKMSSHLFLEVGIQVVALICLILFLDKNTR